MGLDGLRPAARAYIAALVGLALCLVLLALGRTAVPTPGDLVLAGAFAACAALATMFPIPFGHRMKFSVDTAMAVAAVLLLAPAIAMLAVGAGTLLAHGLRPASRDWAQALFNTAQSTLQAAAGALLLAATGWDPAQPAFGRPDTLLVLPAVGVAMHLVGVLSVATVVALQDAAPVLRSWWPALREDARAEALAQLSLLAAGVLAAIVADTVPWALALLAVPVAGTYFTLQHHVRLRQEAETARQSSDAGLVAAQRLAGLGSWEWDLTTGRQDWSDETCRIFGVAPPPRAPAPAALLGCVHGEDRARVEAAIGEALAHGGSFSVEHRAVRPDGSVRVVHQRGEVLTDATGRPIRVLGAVHDVTERKALEGLLAHRALHDPLTGLPNRVLFAERLDDVLSRSAPPPRTVAVLFVDLDGFKLVNDGLGHEAGDRLLVAVAERLRACVDAGDTIARLGGDEFAILLDDVADQRDPTRLAERLIAALGRFVLNGHEAFVTASVGIAAGPAARWSDPTDLLRAADIALYRAKAAGRGTYAVYEPTMHPPVVARLEREAALRRALEGSELRLHYQPEVDLASGRVVGMEALARWRHPEQGLLPPAAFVPMAEETGLIVPLGRWVLHQACEQARAWQDAIPATRPLWVGINLSPRQFQDAGLAAEVAAALRASRLDPRCLELEITESLAMRDMPATRRILSALRELGVRVAIDDFGTGYSSLAHLRELAPQALKIDRSFVTGLPRDAESRAIVRAVVGLAHDLGLAVTAEGVETAEQATLLRELGVDRGQGFYFAPPAPGHRVGELMARATRLPETAILHGSPAGDAATMA